MTVRVRFAPSPTGHLHVGGARTAIFNWLFARHHHGGSFIIRVEDTDQERSTAESEQMVLGDLRWLGLGWDEGPDTGGPHAPYRQSERRTFYQRVAGDLIASGDAYRCFCTEENLEQRRRTAETEGRAPHYDLTCFRLEEPEVARRLERSQPFAIRFHIPADADVTIDDLIRGEVSWKKESVGDFILVRSDGMPTYNFSVVADDHDMGVTHVIRAEEHLTNTHRQVLIYRALKWAIPLFAHVSLILGEDRSKLSKRHGATSVSAFDEQGYLPAAMVNYLTLLGWSAPDEREVFSRDYAIEHFTLDRVQPSPAIFDKTKLTWLNGQHIQMTSGRELFERLQGRLKREGWIEHVSDPNAREWLGAAIDLVKKGRDLLTDFIPALRFFFSYDPKNAFADHGDLLRRSFGVLEALDRELAAHGVPLDPEGYQSLIARLKDATRLKGKDLFMPIRVALTGTDHGPELGGVLSLLERGAGTPGIVPVEPPRKRLGRLLELMRG